MSRVLLGMSGGVDSSAQSIFKEMGFMKLIWEVLIGELPIN